MKLTRLELSGFKSFADTVNLTFEEGRHRHRGPNGCGKSQRLRRGALGARRAVGATAPRREDGGRDLPGLDRPAPGQRDRGLALPRQHRRRPAHRVPRGRGHPPALAVGAERLPAQRVAGPPPRHPGSAPRHRPRQRRRRGHRGEDDRPAALRPRRRAAVPVRGGGRASGSTATGSTAPSAGSRRRRSISSGSRTSSPKSSRRSGAWPASAARPSAT